MTPQRIDVESALTRRIDVESAAVSTAVSEISSAQREVLVVEDDADTRALLVARIERLGYLVRAVSTGEQAVAAASNGPAPRLVVLDLLLPGIDGWEVLRRLRDDPRTAQVPVVVASILDPVDDRVAHYSSYLVKPYRKTEFERMVQRLAGPPARPEARGQVPHQRGGQARQAHPHEGRRHERQR